MRPFFSTQLRVCELARIGGSWIGTPFHPNGMVKGRGVSCQMLVAAVLLECGHLPIDAMIEEGPMDWHGKNSLIENALDGQHVAKFANIFGTPSGEVSSQPPHPPGGDPIQLIQPGDVLGFTVNSSVHHCGIAITSTEFLHVLRHSAASIMPVIDAMWITRLRRVWRPIE